MAPQVRCRMEQLFGFAGNLDVVFRRVLLIRVRDNYVLGGKFKV